MKLTKKLEAEILKLYKAYWDAYLNGDMKALASMLADDITIVGTAVSEVFNNKKDALKFYKATADQLIGKAQFRNREIGLQVVENNILVNEQSDLFVLIEKKWTYYGHARISAVLKQTGSGWKVINQHASFPDTRADEGEQLAAEKIKEENLQLRDAVKRRTLELEDKNRELEIESAVERVRAKALAMHRSEDIHEVVRVLRNELFGLKVGGIIGSTICLKQPDGSVRLWDITDVETNGRYGWDILFDISKVDPRLWVKKIWSSKKKIIATEQNSNDLKRTLKWLSQYDKKTANDLTKLLKVNKITHGWHRAVKLDNGVLITDFVNEAPPEVGSILLKLGAAFDLAYKRFLDLKKAEAQARAAQIEVAVERVRAKAMAMHRSEDIISVVNTLRIELGSLNIPGIAAATITLKQDNGKIRLWDITTVTESADGFHFAMDIMFGLDDTKPTDWIRRIWDAKEKYFVYKQDKKDFKRTLEWTRKYSPGFVKNAERFIKKNNIQNSWHPAVPLSHGKLSLDLLQEPAEEVRSILTKMATAFDLAYKRFLDLKKAEAQTREALIEAGLERVRSRAMAMQSSEEVNALIGTVFSELTKLDLVLTRCIIWVFEPATNDARWWMANGEEPSNPMNFLIKYHKHPAYLTFVNAWKNQNVKFVYDLKGQDKKNWDKVLFNKTELKNLPAVVKNGMRKPERVLLSASFNNFGGINVASLEPLSGEHFDILLRFAKVFDLTYTRFLDLKKAEAQAREAQIESALERVRSKTMAMQRSAQLDSVIKTVYAELKQLDVSFDRCFIMIFDEQKGATWWMGSPEHDLFHKGFYVPYHEHQPHLAYLRGWQERQQKWEYTLEGKIKEDWDDFIFNKTELSRLPPPAIEYMRSFGQACLAASFESFGCMTTGGQERLNEESFNILGRFAKVFDQTYRRFLDLQKAEAQAREAEIELALERVRARTMAMHQSKEIADIVGKIFTELTQLDLVLNRVLIWIFNDEQKYISWWSANREIETNAESYRVDYNKEPVFLNYLHAWQKRIPLHLYTLSGDLKKRWEDHLFTNTELSKIPIEVRNGMRSEETIFTTSTIGDYGLMMVGGFEPLSDENTDIIQRFGRVFQQSYTRYLDVQNAEAQSRESQIQLALERVRARTMAMQKSDELPETSFLLFQQMKELGETAVQNSIGIVKEEQGYVELSTTIHGHAEPKTLHVPIGDMHVMSKAVAAWRSNRKSLKIEFHGQELKEYNQLRNSFLETKVNFPEDHWIVNIVFFSKGWLSFSSNHEISKESFQLLERFAAVFDQTYIRFLDLQKAEAQAREAQIEAALERVRSRTMAMQRSEELAEVATILFQQVKALGIPQWACGFNIFEIDDKECTWYPGSPDGKILSPCKVPLTEHPVFISLVESKKRGDELFIYEKEGEYQADHYRYMMTVPGMRDLLQDRLDTGLKIPTFQIDHVANFSHGNLIFITYEHFPEMHDIFKRFAKVFDLTYTRFLDLQNAEAQARESQIQLALERVRARTMAMQKSNELPQAATLLFQQLQSLGMPAFAAGYCIWDDDKQAITLWMSSEGVLQPPFKAPTTEDELFIQMRKGYEQGKALHVVEMGGEELVAHYRYMRTLPVVGQIFDSIVEAGHSLPEFQVMHQAYFSNGFLLFITYEPVPQAHEIFKRFAVVFDQTYTRFLDLQKAEAQAHEARIEISLERIRARALAMHKSDELIEVAKVLWEQMTLLGQRELESCVVHLYEGDPDHIHSYRAVSINTDSKGTLTYGHMAIPKNSCEVVREWVTEFQGDLQEYTLEISGARQQEWYELLYKLAPEVVNSMRQKGDIHEKRYYRFSKFSGGALLMILKEEPKEEASYLQKRAAIVFDLAYRRFLDLQKAEAQTRESQIETALERVRAVAMAMRKPEELMEISEVIYKQLGILGFTNVRNVQIAIDNDHKNTYSGVEYSEYYQNKFSEIPYDSSPLFREIANEIKSSSSAFYQKIISGKEFEEWKKWRTNVNDENHEGIHPGVATASSMCFYLHSVGTGMLGISTFEPISDEQLVILKRLKNVFELSYRRYIDIEKAEAQAREAQIEAALEKVRSRSLAMHKSDELQDVVHTVFEKLKELNVDFYTVIILVFEHGSKDILWWMENKVNQQYSKILIRYSDNAYLEDLYKAKRNGKDLFSKCYSGDGKNKLYNYLLHDTDLKYVAADQKKFLLENEFATISVALAKNTGIHITSYSKRSFSEQENEILKRFSNVFEQAYIRFMDLQKAEAQAKEAQVEAALEKVRSRSLAMHRSDELQEVVNTVFERLTDLGIEADSTNIAIFKEGQRDYDYWIASHFQKRSASFHMPYIDISLTKDIVAARETGTDYSANSYSFDTKNEWFHYAFQHTDFRFLSEERKQFILNAPAITVAVAFSKNTGIQINRYSSTLLSEGEAEILKRFSKVFEQAYIRFLDLEKAEAQAREAQIEAALERIRSRSLAMHHSQELKEVIMVAFEKLKELGVLHGTVGIQLFDQKTMNAFGWVGTSIQDPQMVNMPFDEGMMSEGNFLSDCWQAMNSGTDMINKEYPVEQKNKYFNHLFANNDLIQIPQQARDFLLQMQRHTICFFPQKNSSFFVDSWNGELFSNESVSVIKRAAKVFEQAYIRFLDLQKAEANAREAQIEAALERVRAKAMAMHKTEDLNPAVATMFAELEKLDLGMLRCGIGIINKNNKTVDVWLTSKSDEGTTVQVSGDESMDIHPLLQGAFNAWVDHQDFSYVLEGDDMAAYYKTSGMGNVRLPESQLLLSGDQIRKQYYHLAVFQEGGLFAFHDKEFPGEAKVVMKRFANVFDLTYKRFLDIQKAAAQARESQIQLALERVRARTMAMQKSDELPETSHILFQQMKELGEPAEQLTIGVVHEENNVIEVSATLHGGMLKKIYWHSIDEPFMMNKIYRAWKAQQKTLVVELKGDQLNAYNTYRNELTKSNMFSTDLGDEDRRIVHAAFFSKGMLALAANEPRPKESIELLERFASVFDLTYTRFSDLKNAEAQAREAQIEAGLERVRARTMAMHNSEDVSIATATMFTELEKLGIENFRGGILNIRMDKTMDVWSVNKAVTNDPNDPEGKDRTIRAAGEWDMTLHPWWRELYERWINKEDIHYLLVGKDKDDYVKLLDARRDYLPGGIKELPDCHIQGYYFGEGAVWTFSLQPPPEEHKQIMKRFASVFSLTFRRYQDLKKAEAQAREATIEAALERVRGKAMAMHSSKDLTSTIGVFYHELQGLSLTPRRCGVGLLNKETWRAEISTMNATADGQTVELVGIIDMRSHPVLTGVYNNWLNKTEYHPILRGNEIKEYYQLLRPQVAFPDYPDDTIQYGYFFFFDEGGVYAWTEKELQEEELKIYRRFTSVLSLTYKRYRDLKDAEQRAQNAIKEAALDRIRADIASMRTVEDLDRITPLIWNELTTLNIPFIRCGVFIMDETQKIIHTYLSTPEGKAIAAFHLPYDTPGNFAAMLDHWYNKRTYISRWGELDFIGIADTLVKQGAIASKEQYLSSLPKGGFYLHFLPFLQGMLYVGNTERLNDEQIQLIGHVADAFSTAYARYEDFNRLEAAKQQVENTLTDLKQAQTQLVQSEKMASLGELTAGIAHEIQNPLNFVNNFSDVSNELLEEMKQELATGNTQQAIEIANDVIDNLDKILHHGKRADAIVKGMLQHSRTSSGQKEMTDINILADEYLRLAYHGLRAKDKSFNAKFETHFDVNIGKVNIIPQDIGRVILNLINNAFYTVTEKKKHAQNGYEPTVTVTTFKDNGRIEIKVKDNGNGISQKILDKIFQPFFTTKPTGQGTGLGLSLAYDIITKGHGGELKVETKEGEGSEFVIQLPMQ